MRVPMKTLEYTITFNTPAFLGNAEQSAQWRTPPFKALLRQWWRVVFASRPGSAVDLESMRREEGRLFGNASLSHKEGSKVIADHSKSLVRIRLSNPKGSEAWSLGTQQGVSPLQTGEDTSYAWFGLVNRGKGAADRSGIKAMHPEGCRQLRLAVPLDDLDELTDTLMLINAFGLMGSRSRGGWGALSVDGIEKMKPSNMARYARELADCLRSDWAMSLAKDANGLCVWESVADFESWDKAMRFIAFRRKSVRTALKAADLRAALGFATRSGRMPSPLRWKVLPSSNGKLVVRVFAMPHRIPDNAGTSLSSEKLATAWNLVIREFDASNSDFQRIQNKGNQS
jgi:CRISPR-associated protein Cmr1